MDMAIVKGDFNASYVNNFTYIDFNIQDTIINTTIEVTDWRIPSTYLPGSG